MLEGRNKFTGASVRASSNDMITIFRRRITFVSQGSLPRIIHA
jgi:hypothetical protein